MNEGLVLIAVIQPAPQVADQGVVTLRNWALLEVGAERILIGNCDEAGGKVRTSTNVERVLVHSREVVTASGRLYRLVGPRGPVALMDRVGSSVAGRPCKDVTAELEAQFQAA